MLSPCEARRAIPTRRGPDSGSKGRGDICRFAFCSLYYHRIVVTIPAQIIIFVARSPGEAAMHVATTFDYSILTIVIPAAEFCPLTPPDKLPFSLSWLGTRGHHEKAAARSVFTEREQLSVRTGKSSTGTRGRT